MIVLLNPPDVNNTPTRKLSCYACQAVSRLECGSQTPAKRKVRNLELLQSFIFFPVL